MNAIPTLFDAFAGRIDAPAVRHSVTSVKAAEQITPHTETLRERVYRHILTNGPVTDQEIQAALRLDPSTERPRRVELMQAGRIVQQGTHKTYAGRDAAAWVVAR